MQSNIWSNLFHHILQGRRNIWGQGDMSQPCFGNKALKMSYSKFCPHQVYDRFFFVPSIFKYVPAPLRYVITAQSNPILLHRTANECKHSSVVVYEMYRNMLVLPRTITQPWYNLMGWLTMTELIMHMASSD